MPDIRQRAVSVLPEGDRSAWITAQRPPKARVDPFKPEAFFLEQERWPAGQILSSGTVLLTNTECPWRCLMCDLWKHTLSELTPIGAIPRQIDYALARFDCRPEQIKLYNSGSFFDAAAVPVTDYAAIAERISFARNIVVEAHPRLVGGKALRFRDLLEGSLEVAMGLETVHPEVLPLLNKRFDLTHFSAAGDFLRREGIALRAFVLVKPPFLEEQEAVEWAVKSVEFAFACGAKTVSLIPTRPGNGAMDRLAEAGEFSPPSLAALERTLERALKLAKGQVFADTWDLDRFSRCPECLGMRRQRLQTMNLTQTILPSIECPNCG